MTIITITQQKSYNQCNMNHLYGEQLLRLCLSKSRFCDRKFDFLFHWRPNQSKIATIYLRTWIVQIGISIWFEMFVPFSGNSLDPDREVQSTRSTLARNMAKFRKLPAISFWLQAPCCVISLFSDVRCG